MPYIAERTKPTVNPSDYYSRKQIEAFGEELHQLYLKTKDKVGQEDLEIMRRLDTISQWFERLGRSLIHFSPGPISWLSGSTLLAAHYVMEFTNGHNIMHGHYDQFKDERLNSDNFSWDLTTPEIDWKFEHHTLHHPFTNVAGKDSDYGYLLFRVNDDQPWHLRFLPQISLFISLPFSVDKLFPWYIATARAIVEDREIVTLQTYGGGIERVLKKLAKNYLLYPLMAGPMFAKVAAGNFMAEAISNAHTILMLAIEHHSEDIPLIEMATNETRGDFYLRQIIASQNYELPGWYEDLFTGAVNIHIEHHLFPDLPFNRLKEMAPEVEAICNKYNVPYRKANVFEAIGHLLELALKKSLPTKKEDKSSLDLLLNPGELFNRIIDGVQQIVQSVETPKDLTFVDSRVIEVTEETPLARRIKLRLPAEFGKVKIRGGQYISIKVRIGGIDHVRQYSLVETGQPGHLTIVVKSVKDGLVSNHIQRNLKKGEKITIVGGIKGDFQYHHTDSQQIFIAGGVGITPVYAMLDELAKTTQDLSKYQLYYFNNDASSIILHNQIEVFRNQYGLQVEHFLASENNLFSEQWFSQAVAENKISKDAAIYACAPTAMLEKLESAIEKNGLDTKKYFTENFSVASKDFALTGRTHNVELLSSKKSFQLDEGEPVLNGLEKAGINIPSGCRKGLCKACLVKVENGSVESEDNKTKNLHSEFITSCNSFARGDLKIWL